MTGKAFTISRPSTSAITLPDAGSVNFPSYDHRAGFVIPHRLLRKFVIVLVLNGSL